jgi:hypothetical protein
MVQAAHAGFARPRFTSPGPAFLRRPR